MNLRVDRYLFFNKAEICSRNRLIKLYGVKKRSYAGNVVMRVYDSYFGNAINIKKEFSKYYKKEFKTCEQFLVCRFNMTEELAKKVCNEKTHYVDLEWKGDQIWYSFSYDDELKKQFWRFVGGIEYED